MFLWLATAAIFNVVYRPSRRGRKVAYLTVVSFGFLVVTLAIFLLVDTEHGGSGEQKPAAATSPSLESSEGRS